MTKKMNENFIKLVRILNDGEYHDGNSLGEKLSMTRSAIWKVIKKLEAYQVAIDSIKGKGYALLEPLILLDAKKIRKNLSEENIDLVVFESIDSTSDYLKKNKHTKNIRICIAEKQDKGRGRLGRQWYAPFGKNIYFSCLFPFQKDISELAGLSLVTSLAIIKTLKSYGICDDLFVKWPNDIVYQNKKLSGCLIEIQAESHGESHAIIGIGINVNMLEDDHHITQAWTSIRKIVDEYIDRNELCSRLLKFLLNDLRQFEKQGFAPFAAEWMRMDCLMDKTITLKTMTEIVKGKVAGINEQGHLLLQTNGKIRAFSSGDATIVKK